MIIKINILAATSEQFLVILNNSLGMPVWHNKVLVGEIWVKNDFYLPYTAIRANWKNICCGFLMTRYPKITCVKFETKQKNKTLVWVGLEQPPFYQLTSP